MMPRHKLSDALLRGNKLGNGEGQVDYWDTLTPGFGVRVSYGGRKSFMVMTRVDGRLRRFTLKPAYPFLSLADARVQATRIIKDAQVGLDPAAAKAMERKAAQALHRNAFGAVAADFMQDHAKNLRTRKEMQRKIDVELLPHWGDRPIASITRTDVKALLREKARHGPIAANRLLALVSKIFTWALDEEIVQASPAVRLPRHAKEQERERALTAEEIKTLWAAFGKLGYPFGAVFRMLLVTGQRRGEVADMKWSEIGSDGWKLPGARVKSSQGHLVPLSSLAREILRCVPRVGDHVFAAYNDKALQGWSKAKARADAVCTEPVAPWRIHDLRRTAATHMRSLGVDRLVVSKVLNHAEGGVTRIYDRYAADPEKASALERWAQRLREIVSGKAEENVVVLHRAVQA
jgi:integrase